ncbi:hypothetical protein [Cupriavidus sp. RAF12]|uniref:hypothetical protein n=1 Tax=Cupriavidus sp. RAF12 TaxID=3233050 RepID=UPI003F91FDFE
MHQAIASSMMPNQVPLRSEPVGNLAQRTAACIHALRQEAAALRMQLQVQRFGSRKNDAPQEDVVHLLQKAAMLETGADVLALTSGELR